MICGFGTMACFACAVVAWRYSVTPALSAKPIASMKQEAITRRHRDWDKQTPRIHRAFRSNIVMEFRRSHIHNCVNSLRYHGLFHLMILLVYCFVIIVESYCNRLEYITINSRYDICMFGTFSKTTHVSKCCAGNTPPKERPHEKPPTCFEKRHRKNFAFTP